MRIMRNLGATKVTMSADTLQVEFAEPSGRMASADDEDHNADEEVHDAPISSAAAAVLPPLNDAQQLSVWANGSTQTSFGR